jgi:hypothetical protein
VLYTQNGNLTPNDVSYGGGKKVWWLCCKGHEWQATIKNRTLGRNCPFCAGKKATPEKNFARLYPEISEQWHPSKSGFLKVTEKDVQRAEIESDWNSTRIGSRKNRAEPVA